MIMLILVLFGLISIMVIYFNFDIGNLMQYLVVAYSVAVILKLFVEINEVSYLKKIYRIQAQQDDKLRHLIYLLEQKYSNISDSSNVPNSSDMFDITQFDLSSRLKEYILTLRNFDLSSESGISQQIQLYTNYINSKPMPELIMHKIISYYFNFTVNDWMDREIYHGVDFFDHSEYVIEFVDNLALVLSNT